MRKIKYIMGYIYIQIKNKNEQKKLRVTSIAAKRTSKEIFLVYITVVQFHRAFGDLKSSGKLWSFYDVPLYFVNTVRCVNVLLRVFKQTVIRKCVRC